ncbi:MAG: HAD-IA family hydrolase [Ectothiorhodospiraceae bacterium]|nr:HAD-IA family hydrolase [Ectothiorhodospiraceae bacterium]
MTGAYRLVVFDWDGTLADSHARIVRTVTSAIEAMDLPARSEAAIRGIIGLGMREATEALYPGEGEAMHQRFLAHYRERWSREAREPVALFAGAHRTLAHLDTAGLLLAVATGKGRRGLDRELAESDTTRFFVATRTVDESPSKPHPGMVLELMEEVGCAPEETLVVGDTTFDLQMARAAGAHALGVASGAHPAAALLECRPVALLDTVAELPAWLIRRG